MNNNGNIPGLLFVNMDSLLQKIKASSNKLGKLQGCQGWFTAVAYWNEKFRCPYNKFIGRALAGLGKFSF